jgi:hypothetical protein
MLVCRSARLYNDGLDRRRGAHDHGGQARDQAFEYLSKITVEPSMHSSDRVPLDRRSRKQATDSARTEAQKERTLARYPNMRRLDVA